VCSSALLVIGSATLRSLELRSARTTICTVLFICSSCKESNRHWLLVCRGLKVFTKESGPVKIFAKYLKGEEHVCIFLATEGSCHLL